MYPNKNSEPRIYGSKWERERLIFLRSHPLCVMCHEQGRVTAATVVDHIIPHKLKEALRSGDSRNSEGAKAFLEPEELARAV